MGAPIVARDVERRRRAGMVRAARQEPARKGAGERAAIHGHRLLPATGEQTRLLRTTQGIRADAAVSRISVPARIDRGLLPRQWPEARGADSERVRPIA